MDIENTTNNISYRVTHHNDSAAGYKVILDTLDGLKIKLDEDFTLSHSNQSDAKIRVHVFHQLDDLKILQQYLENADANLIVLTFDSDSSAIDRQTGSKSSKILALRKGILLKEYPLDTFSEGQYSFKNDLIITITNLVCYLVNGQNSNPQLETTWQRYLHSNVHLKLYQRLFFKNKVIRAKTKPSSLANKEVYENIPVSFQNFKLDKSLNERMLRGTRIQSELWCKISADWAWQKKNLDL